MNNRQFYTRANGVTNVSNGEGSVENMADETKDPEELKRKERIRKAKLKQQEICERLNRKRSASNDSTTPAASEERSAKPCSTSKPGQDIPNTPKQCDESGDNNLLVEDDEGNFKIVIII